MRRDSSVSTDDECDNDSIKFVRYPEYWMYKFMYKELYGNFRKILDRE